MRFRGITRNVVVLGWVSFLTDLASEMLYPVMPLFLVGTLGCSAAVLGVVDGVAEGISSGLRWLGGALSDRYRRRKPFVFAGYAISALSKPLMGLSKAFGGPLLFAIGRCSDRLGKSIRTSARDALIAESTAPEHRGAAFGFHRAMDTAGAVLGPLVTLLIVVLVVGPAAAFAARWAATREEIARSADVIQRLPLAELFFIAVIPGLLSAALVWKSVAEILPAAPGTGGRPPLFQRYPAALWHLMAANALFSLANSSDSFLILRSAELGMGFGQVILAFALYNAVYAAASAPFGRLSDYLGRKPVIVAGWLVYAAVYAGFAVFRHPLAPWALLAAYGLYQALAEGVSKAFVSDLVPAEKRAGAIGLFYTVSGLGQLLGTIVAGVLWQVRLFDGRVMAPFALGALLAALAVPVVATVRTPQREA